jgi:predicted AlkP superfamily pyrophosphatase or phosphodiesterase
MASGPSPNRSTFSVSFNWSHIVVVFLLSSCCRSRHEVEGTPTGANKLLLMLIDGFRWDYFSKFGANELPGFNKLRQSGVSAESFVPVFPSLSFVNYYAIMTG